MNIKKVNAVNARLLNQLRGHGWNAVDAMFGIHAAAGRMFVWFSDEVEATRFAEFFRSHTEALVSFDDDDGWVVDMNLEVAR